MRQSEEKILRRKGKVMEAVIVVDNLRKVYPGGITAVTDISFEVRKGEIFGFLGPNGAGKTTTILMLITLLKPTSGRAMICGFDVVREPARARQCIGYVAQDIAVDENLTGRENLWLQGRFYHLPTPLLRQRIDEVLKMVGLSERADDLVLSYSGGMRKRLDIAEGLIHRPQILFLDEPTLGLDIQTRRKIWDYIFRLKEEEKITIFLTTHYMDEADALCDRVAIIDYGEIKAIGSPDRLKKALGGDVLILNFGSALADKVDSAIRALKEVTFVSNIRAGGNGVYHLLVKEGEKATPKIFDLLANLGVRVESVSLKRPTLDDVFLHHTGHALREEGGESFYRMRMALRRARR
jgi:ABC-2 type transport system ATP-binding protein